jgi:hypothetical protein
MKIVAAAGYILVVLVFGSGCFCLFSLIIVPA